MILPDRAEEGPAPPGMAMAASGSNPTSTDCFPPRSTVMTCVTTLLPLADSTVCMPGLTRNSCGPAPVMTTSSPSTFTLTSGSFTLMTIVPSAVRMRRTVATKSDPAAPSATSAQQADGRDGEPALAGTLRAVDRIRRLPALRLAEVGEAAAEQVGDLGGRLEPLGRVLGVEPGDDRLEPVGDVRD